MPNYRTLRYLPKICCPLQTIRRYGFRRPAVPPLRAVPENPDGVLDKYVVRSFAMLVDEFRTPNHLQYAIIRKFINYDGSPAISP